MQVHAPVSGNRETYRNRTKRARENANGAGPSNSNQVEKPGASSSPPLNNPVWDPLAIQLDLAVRASVLTSPETDERATKVPYDLRS